LIKKTFTFKAWLADAFESVYFIVAGCVVLAGVGQALVDVRLAVGPAPSRLTGTRIAPFL
jgi:hypothetical protein